MRRIATRLALVALLGLAVTASAGAGPSVSINLNPELPDYVQNPGGQLRANVWVDPQGTTPLQLVVMILDPNDEHVYEMYIPGQTFFELDWTAPQGIVDGIYRLQVEYWSVENGLEQITGDQFLIAGLTPGICAFMYCDENGNGQFDNGEPRLEGVEVCYTGPEGDDCKLTDEDGAACWFLLPLGDYEVCVTPETLPPGYEMTSPVCVDLTLEATEIEQVFFSACPTSTATEAKTWGAIKAIYD